jgi:putative redox protein
MLEDDGGPMTVEAPSEEQQYSPFHMMGSSLAYCTHSVLASWAQHASLDADALRIEVSWSFGESPHRVASYDVRLHWSSLPAERRAAAVRAASLCAVHATLSHPPRIEVQTEP